jgi:hypothetical protein
MIKTVAVIAFFALPFVSFSQNKSVAALHEKYKEDNVFTLNFTGNSDLADALRSLHILAVSSGSKGYSPRDIRKLKKQIGKQSFEELFSVKSNGGQLQLLARDRNGKPGELIMIIDKDSEGFITMDLSEK